MDALVCHGFQTQMNKLQSHVAKCLEQLDVLQKQKNDLLEHVGVCSAEGEDKRAKLNAMKKSVGYSGNVAIGMCLAETLNWLRIFMVQCTRRVGRDQMRAWSF